MILWNRGIISTLIIFTVLLSGGCEKSSAVVNQSSPPANKVVRYIENNAPSFAKHGNRNRLVFLLDFNDFSCPPCFDDFIILCDKINDIFSKDSQEHIAGVFRQGNIVILQDSKKLLYWKEINNINFITLVGPDSIFKSIGFTKSMAIVVDNNNRIIFSEHFPMGEKGHNTILKLIKGNK